MASQLTVVLSYKKLAAHAPLPTAITESSEPRLLSLMTINFRMCFWRIFDRVWKIEFDETKVTLFDLPATISDVRLMEVRASKTIGSADYILVATLHFDADLETLTKARAGLRDQHASGHLVRFYEALLKTTPAAAVLEALSADLAGHSSWTASASDAALEHLPYLTGFYHYGWILALRIDRDIIRMNLSIREIANQANARAIISRRIQLIQIQRCFLNEDRSNNKALQGVCAQLLEKYKLRNRFERLSQVHRAMEEHLDNTFKVLQSNATRATNVTVQLLTFSAIPIGILSLLLTLNFASSIFSEGHRVFADATLHLLLALSFLAPLVLVISAMLIDRLANRPRD